jgi:hypothetical protein
MTREEKGNDRKEKEKSMILDKENMFSHGQAVTATAASDSTVDLGPGDAGPSERLSLFVTCDPPFTGAGTLSVELETADETGADGDLVAPPVIVYPVADEALTAGGRLLAARLPHGCKRYLRLNYAVTGSLADGKITAGLTWDVQADPG